MTTLRRALAGVLVGTAGLATGCDSGPAMHPVTAKVVNNGGNLADLAGSTVDAMRADDPATRASGTIGPDGTVVLESLHAGRVRTGAQEGKYVARIVLADDDPATKRKAAKAVARKYLDFKTAGLSFQVPPPGEVTLSVSTR